MFPSVGHVRAWIRVKVQTRCFGIPIEGAPLHVSQGYSLRQILKQNKIPKGQPRAQGLALRTDQSGCGSDVI